MKLLKFKMLFLLIAVLGLTIISCDETTTDPTEENPVITSIVPPNMEATETITITGTDFGAATDDGSVYFGDIQAKGEVGATDSDYKSWSDTKIEVNIPAAVANGPVKIKVYNGATGKFSATVDYYVGTQPKPQPPTGLMATSIDKNTIRIKWTASPSESEADFKGYVLTVTPAPSGGTPNYEITKGLTQYDIAGLLEGTEYTFSLVAKYNAGGLSTAATVVWSPATRFGASLAIKMYETDSKNFGSGLDLYDATTGGPVTKKLSVAAEKAVANLGIYTKGGLFFQSGSEIESGSGNAQATEISADYFDGTNSLDNVFDSQALDAGSFSAKSLNIDDESLFSPAGGVVFIVRTKEPGNTAYTYAKVLIKRTGGKFLQGSGDDEYIELEISYQKTAGVPYARTR